MPTMAHFDEMLGIEHYLKNPEFITFLKQSALEAMEQASAEELAEFVFGGLDESIEAFDAELGSPASTLTMAAADEDDDEFDDDDFEDDDFDEDEDDDDYGEDDLDDLKEFDPDNEDEEDDDDDEDDEEDFDEDDDDVKFEEFDDDLSDFDEDDDDF